MTKELIAWLVVVSREFWELAWGQWSGPIVAPLGNRGCCFQVPVPEPSVPVQDKARQQF